MPFGDRFFGFQGACKNFSCSEQHRLQEAFLYPLLEPKETEEESDRLFFLNPSIPDQPSHTSEKREKKVD